MLRPVVDVSMLFESIQRDTDQCVRDGALDIVAIGGQEAVKVYLNNTMLGLLSVAIKEQGVDAACELMAAGLETAEAIAGPIGC